MNDGGSKPLRSSLAKIPEHELLAHISGQRWFGSKSREPTGLRLLDEVVLRLEPLLVLALAEIGFDKGSHEIYQLLVVLDGGDGPAGTGVGRAGAPHPLGAADLIANAGSATAFDAFADPNLAGDLVSFIRAGSRLEGSQGSVKFHAYSTPDASLTRSRARRLGIEQSNSSIVLGEELIIKAFRQVEAGINPELELLAFLNEHGFGHVPALSGWWSYDGPLMTTTLGIVQRYLPDAIDGWSLASEQLASQPETFVERLVALGQVVGAMHALLASDYEDLAFSPEQPSAEAVALLTATIDEELSQLFLQLSDHAELAPIAARENDLRELLRSLGDIGSFGLTIRQHGDLHLGQALWAQDRWFLVDFEGEPARPLLERRRKRSPLRDVAGMLRSFAYAVAVNELDDGAFGRSVLESRAREAFLGSYLGAVQSVGLLPESADAISRMLTIFELEKAVYELRYELDNRPDWIRVPAAGLTRLLEESL